jgi:hypothetical protein
MTCQCIWIITWIIRHVSIGGAVTVYPSMVWLYSLPPFFGGVCVAQSVTYCVVCCQLLFVIYIFSFGHCIVCLAASDHPLGNFKRLLLDHTRYIQAKSALKLLSGFRKDNIFVITVHRVLLCVIVSTFPIHTEN